MPKISAGEMHGKGFTFGKSENDVWCCMEIPFEYAADVLTV